MKKYFDPEFEIVTFSFDKDICEGSFPGNDGDLKTTVPDDWEYGDADPVQ